MFVDNYLLIKHLLIRTAHHFFENAVQFWGVFPHHSFKRVWRVALLRRFAKEWLIARICDESIPLASLHSRISWLSTSWLVFSSVKTVLLLTFVITFHDVVISHHTFLAWFTSSVAVDFFETFKYFQERQAFCTSVILVLLLLNRSV